MQMSLELRFIHTLYYHRSYLTLTSAWRVQKVYGNLILEHNETFDYSNKYSDYHYSSALLQQHYSALVKYQNLSFCNKTILISNYLVRRLMFVNLFIIFSRFKSYLRKCCHFNRIWQLQNLLKFSLKNKLILKSRQHYSQHQDSPYQPFSQVANVIDQPLIMKYYLRYSFDCVLFSSD